MTTKQWMERAFYLNEEIKQLTDAKQKAKELNDAGGGVSGYREYSRILFKKIEKQLAICMEITNAVSRLEKPLYRAIFTARYINFKTWEEIAEELELDLRWVYRLNQRALGEMEKIIEEFFSK